MTRIHLLERTAPSDGGRADEQFSVAWRARNDSGVQTPGHWDHLAIIDDENRLHYEEWHQSGPLDPGACYDASLEVPGLPAGSYTLWLTLDGGAEDCERDYFEFEVLAA